MKNPAILILKYSDESINLMRNLKTQRGIPDIDFDIYEDDYGERWIKIIGNNGIYINEIFLPKPGSAFRRMCGRPIIYQTIPGYVLIPAREATTHFTCVLSEGAKQDLEFLEQMTKAEKSRIIWAALRMARGNPKLVSQDILRS